MLEVDRGHVASAPAGTEMLFACRPSAWTWAGRSRAGDYGSFDNLHSDREEGVLVFRYMPRSRD
jgi:hypothetical protein